MSDIFNESQLEKKMGPLPVWAWAGVIAGIAYFWYKRHQAKLATAATTTPPGTIAPTLSTGVPDPAAVQSNGGFDPNTAIDTYLSQNPLATSYPVGSVAEGVPAPVTNEQWARLGADAEMQKGADPTIVSDALAHYLASAPLSAAEQAVVNTVLTMFGEPPQGVMALNTTPGPTNNPPPSNPPPVTPSGPKFQDKTVTVKSTSNLWGLAAETYPNATATELEQIVYLTVIKQPQYGNNTVPAGHTVTFIAGPVK